MNRYIYTLILLVFSYTTLLAQDPLRFKEEINTLSEIPKTEAKNVAIFTGSSSVRFWVDLKEDCSEMVAINTGFGGSEMSDLNYFLNEAVLRFEPDNVYIYEGDNDIFSGKEPSAILATAKEIVGKILDFDPYVKIYFISAKPSPSRWVLKEQYISYNGMLKNYCESNNELQYINVWDPMLGENGRPNPQIFTSDSLHMNIAGYLLWKDIICNNN